MGQIDDFELLVHATVRKIVPEIVPSAPQNRTATGRDCASGALPEYSGSSRLLATRQVLGVDQSTPHSAPPFPSSHRADAYYRVKLIVTVTRTGTGTPFRRVGVYSHCRTASSAA